VAWLGTVAGVGRRMASVAAMRPTVQRSLFSPAWHAQSGRSRLPRFSRGLSDDAAKPEDADADVVNVAPQQSKPLLADENPTKHRQEDVGKIYRIDAEKLKKIFPEGLCGELHNVLYGKRTKEAHHRNDKWWDLVLKDHPGILIRPEAMQLISSLYCLSKNGLKKGAPRMDSAGYLLDGASGVGKSTVLNHVVHWARSSGDWLVVFVPQASRLVSGLGFYARGDPEPEGEGKIILQPSFALEFLSTLVEANKEKLTKLPFQKKASTIEAANVVDAVQQLTELKLELKEAQAMDVFLDTLDTLREQTEFPLLVAVDEFNALQGMSLYEDYKLKLIPAHNVVMAEALSRFTADTWKRGVLVGAATRTGKFGNVPLPGHGKKGNRHSVVSHYSRDDIKRYMTFMYQAGDLFTPVTDELVDYMFFTTQGRARIVEEYLGSEVFNRGLHNLPKKRKVGRWYHLNEGGPDTMFHPETGKPQEFYTHVEIEQMRLENERKRIQELDGFA